MKTQVTCTFLSQQKQIIELFDNKQDANKFKSEIEEIYPSGSIKVEIGKALKRKSNRPVGRPKKVSE